MSVSVSFGRTSRFLVVRSYILCLWLDGCSAPAPAPAPVVRTNLDVLKGVEEQPILASVGAGAAGDMQAWADRERKELGDRVRESERRVKDIRDQKAALRDVAERFRNCAASGDVREAERLIERDHFGAWLLAPLKAEDGRAAIPKALSACSQTPLADHLKALRFKAVRVHGDTAFAAYEGPDGDPRFFVLRNMAGSWKVVGGDSRFLWLLRRPILLTEVK